MIRLGVISQRVLAGLIAANDNEEGTASMLQLAVKLPVEETSQGENAPQCSKGRTCAKGLSTDREAVSDGD